MADDHNRCVDTLATPVLEVGGTHVSAALVDVDAGTLVGPARRRDLDGAGPAEAIIDAFVAAGATVAAPEAATWGVAMPDPFDYRRGIALFDGVGKFESLRGFDVGAELVARLPGRPRRIAFLNDADAFTLGEAAYGAAVGYRRCVGLTLGTGVGSGWIVDGRIVASGPGVPPDGRAHRLEIDGAPLEDTVSRRAIRRAYARACGDSEVDVREIAERARAGQDAARAVLRHAMGALAAALGPCVRDFGADIIVVGGSMARSWDLFGPWFEDGFADVAKPPPMALAQHPDDAPLLGAARFARDGSD
jgi:predicted NBD/HSP70 family sugar kinase